MHTGWDESGETSLGGPDEFRGWLKRHLVMRWDARLSRKARAHTVTSTQSLRRDPEHSETGQRQAFPSCR